MDGLDESPKITIQLAMDGVDESPKIIIQLAMDGLDESKRITDQLDPPLLVFVMVIQFSPRARSFPLCEIFTLVEQFPQLLWFVDIA